MTELRLTRERIIELLTELGQELDRQGQKADLFLVGGAAMALAYNTRRMTADVDGVFEPKSVVYQAARTIAARHREISDDWLNDGVKGFLPGDDPNARVALSSPGVSVRCASPEYLLALKVQASRIDRDPDDIRLLASLCGAHTAGDVLRIAEAVIGTDRLAPKAQFLVEQMFADSGGGHVADGAD